MWVIATLFIRNASHAQRRNNISGERTYAISLTDKKIYTVGLGPHVKRTATVYLKKDNLNRLNDLIETYKLGMGDANMIRDRRSSRIAQTKQYRAQYGLPSWF